MKRSEASLLVGIRRVLTRRCLATASVLFLLPLLDLFRTAFAQERIEDGKMLCEVILARNQSARFSALPYWPLDEVKRIALQHQDNLTIQSELAWYLFIAEDETQTAYDQLFSILRGEPKHALSLARIAFLAGVLGKESEEVLDWWERAEASGWHENWHRPLGKGKALLDLGRPKDALEVYEEAFDTYPMRRGFLTGLARAHYQTGHLRKAWYFDHWTTLLGSAALARKEVEATENTLNGDLPGLEGDLEVWRGLSAELRGDHSSAREHFQAAGEMPFYMPAMKVWTFRKGAEVCFEAGDLSAAQGFIVTGRREFPQSSTLEYLLLQIRLKQERFSEAWQQMLILKEINREPLPSCQSAVDVYLRMSSATSR